MVIHNHGMKVEIEANFFNEGFIMYQANLGPMAILDQILHGPENNSEIESQNLQAKKRPTINIGVFKNCPVLNTICTYTFTHRVRA